MESLDAAEEWYVRGLDWYGPQVLPRPRLLVGVLAPVGCPMVHRLVVARGPPLLGLVVGLVGIGVMGVLVVGMLVLVSVLLVVVLALSMVVVVLVVPVLLVVWCLVLRWVPCLVKALECPVVGPFLLFLTLVLLLNLLECPWPGPPLFTVLVVGLMTLARMIRAKFLRVPSNRCRVWLRAPFTFGSPLGLKTTNVKTRTSVSLALLTLNIGKLLAQCMVPVLRDFRPGLACLDEVSCSVDAEASSYIEYVEDVGNALSWMGYY